MKNLRERRRKKRASHPDFQWMISSMCPERSEFSSPKSEKRFRYYLETLKNFGPQFGVLRWGAGMGRIEEVSESTSGHIYWFVDVSDHGKVKDIMEDIDFQKEVIQYWMGAPSVLIDDLVEIYERKREDWKSKQKLK